MCTSGKLLCVSGSNLLSKSIMVVSIEICGWWLVVDISCGMLFEMDILNLEVVTTFLIVRIVRYCTK